MLLEIFNVRSGAVLDRFAGTETAEGLEVPICGLADPEALVTIDGRPVRRDDRRFEGTARLTRQVNEVVVASSSQYGELRQTLTLVWDKKAFRRYNFSLDDNVFFLTEIARDRPKSLFDHFYLKALKDIHGKYGTCFTANCFFRNDHNPFEIKDFPDIYKSEFEDNSDWLRLAFHAYSEFPDRPYQCATPEKLAADYDRVSSEIVRFAGERTLIPPTNLHFGMVPQTSLHVLRERGMKVNTGSFILAYPPEDAANPLARCCDIGLYYGKDVAEYVVSHLVFYDRFQDMFLCPDAVICNLTPLDRIVPEMDRLLINNPHYNTAIALLSHEQYSYPAYVNYLPDHLRRIEQAAAHATLSGYTPVFFAEGLLGNPAWEEKGNS